MGYVVPELRRRWAYPQACRPGTFREELFGDGSNLQAPHPAAAFRDIEKVNRREAARAGADEAAQTGALA